MKSDRRVRKQRELAQLMRRIDPSGDPKQAVQSFEERKRKHAVMAMGAAILLTAAAALTAGSGLLGEGGVLTRNAAGEGSYIVSLIASVRGEKIETEVTVAEQALTGEAVQELFEEAEEELQERMLGENESADYVIYDLELPSQTDDGMVSAQWTFDSYQVLGSDGSIREDVPEEGELVEVTLTMSYLEQTAESVFSVMVYPAPVSEEEALAGALSDAIAEADENSAAETSFVLPDAADGFAVSWSEPKQYHVLQILLVGILLTMILQYEEEEKIRRAAQKRDAQMMEDYAGIVNKLSLLLGAGMTVYGAWEKVTETYVREQREMTARDVPKHRLFRRNPAEGRRTAYEEMRITCTQIRGGAGESKAYEEFGRRCGLRPYLKLSAILTRNLKLGTAGVTAQLAEEAQEAFEQRKAQARQKGEEAGTKLMLPMLMLLGVVLAIVVIPGFMSM